MTQISLLHFALPTTLSKPSAIFMKLLSVFQFQNVFFQTSWNIYLRLMRSLSRLHPLRSHKNQFLSFHVQWLFYSSQAPFIYLFIMSLTVSSTRLTFCTLQGSGLFNSLSTAFNRSKCVLRKCMMWWQQLLVVLVYLIIQKTRKIWEA